jgi:23S rRNA (guanosine2251-2'-O)-methyltransferase
MARAEASRHEVIAGVHAVLESLAAGERPQRIIIGKRRRDDPALREIVERAKSADVRIDYEDDAIFRSLGDVRHQHVAAYASPFAYAPWGEVREAVRGDAEALVVILDHIEDPQNLGAAMRNAEGAGALAVVIPDRRSAAVTPAARRAAAGAASHLRVASVPNLARAIEDLKSDGCWIYGLAAVAQAVPYTSIDFAGRCAIVIGAEGKGLSRLVSSLCDRLAAIPLRGKVASLNASSAAAIALFEAVRQKTSRPTVTQKNTTQSPVNP